jgi:hypothetical protein
MGSENDKRASKLQNKHYSCIILDFAVNNNSPFLGGQARPREFDGAVNDGRPFLADTARSTNVCVGVEMCSFSPAWTAFSPSWIITGAS